MTQTPSIPDLDWPFNATWPRVGRADFAAFRPLDLSVDFPYRLNVNFPGSNYGKPFMDVTIRQARHDDIEALTTLAMASKQSNGYDDAFMAACADELRVTSASLDAHEYWVAESGTPCGFVCLEVDPDGLAGMIGSLFIAPGWQRRGVGRLLWFTVEELARKKGLRVLRLDADPEAETFYRGLGFSTVSRVPSGSIPGRTLPHMQIDLSA